MIVKIAFTFYSKFRQNKYCHYLLYIKIQLLWILCDCHFHDEYSERHRRLHNSLRVHLRSPINNNRIGVVSCKVELNFSRLACATVLSWLFHRQPAKFTLRTEFLSTSRPDIGAKYSLVKRHNLISNISTLLW